MHTYVNDTQPAAIRLYGQMPERSQERMFAPKTACSVNLICTDNLGKEHNYIVNQEYALLREKQEL